MIMEFTEFTLWLWSDDFMLLDQSIDFFLYN